ncbi:alpha/beta hydrolase [Dactylosporangium darangshiense]|uniref:Alpha/beta hydrolase n=1 Tax=Dactylosporangium darangshiense TaxID=579108 RepID=A0ABP8DRL6_9ACTN
MTEDQFFDAPGGIRLCFRTDGDAAAVPLLLIAGLGLDLTSWPRPMLDGLLARGFRVVRFDNRDAGRSTRVAAAPPSMLRQLVARPPRGAYTLEHMAGDAAALLGHLGIERAHVVGMSMGGMIAQSLAALDPPRVATLTSIFSTTGDRRVGQPARSTLLRMAKRPARTREQWVARHLAMLDHIGSRAFPYDDPDERAWAAGAWDRGGGPARSAGVARQIGAIQASGDRTAALRRITAPTLVIHGDVDRMVHPSGGRATAAAIPGARHVEIAGMSHHLSPGIIDRLVDLIAESANKLINPKYSAAEWLDISHSGESA